MDPGSVDPWWLIHAKLIVASLCGGIVRLLWKPAESATKTIWLVFGCISCGYYGTPVIMAWWGLEPVYRDGVAAFIGLVGLSVAGGLLKAFDSLDFRALLKAWFDRTPAE